jgi:fatty acid desaturase
MLTSTFSQSNQSNWNSYAQQQKPLWNAAALLYTIGGYYGGVCLLCAEALSLNALGIFLVTHALVLSAYLAHELMHGTFFSSIKTNHRWGALMQWLHGTSYARFQDLAQGHIDHHMKGVDLYLFDRIAFVNRLPAALKTLIAALEWLYFPALFLIRQVAGVAIIYQQGTDGDQVRVIAVMLLRVAMFAALGWFSPKGLLLYGLAYVGAIQIISIIDCLQHTYELYPYDAVIPKKSLADEQSHTFSTPISRRYPWLNLLLINFSYHNAHHAAMKCPWYNLPQLDAAMNQQQTVYYISLLQVLANYHRFRIQRLFDDNEGCISVDPQGNLNLDRFYGVMGGTSLLLA